MGLDVPSVPAPCGAGTSAPPRRPGSIRRTSTIDATWPDGMGGETILDGRARDLVTSPNGTASVVAGARMRVVLDSRRLIAEIATTPERPLLDGLVGQSGMGGHRGRLAEVAAADVSAATPLHLLLDDLPGATLVSGSAFRPWYGMERYLAGKEEVRRRVMTGVCTGYQEGSSALAPDGTLRWEQHRERAVGIDDLDDDSAWHELVDHHEVSMRRARRLDLWVSGPTVQVDAFFQDSSTLPEGGRQSIHEYALTAEADAAGFVLRSVEPTPRVLPYRECPLAVPNTTDLIGRPLGELRPMVLSVLAGVAGCTHLNDMLRSLADAPALASALGALSDR
ncbi:DUF2889 domain-containing protein [Streptomyces fulvoviolaceus]|uniref:DUF2889 domain-containing protein n=1 Tax=Streptomyces fulvoviolaceus TaxID=285535 RepID=UPI0007C47F4C|nr:DUF2889 domain-containing protein [Streptomyces fulvoviolaceus]